MKVLTATSATQGWRDNDFFCTVEGEYLAGRSPVGTVLERRGHVVALRRVMREDV